MLISSKTMTESINSSLLSLSPPVPGTSSEVWESLAALTELPRHAYRRQVCLLQVQIFNSLARDARHFISSRSCPAPHINRVSRRRGHASTVQQWSTSHTLCFITPIKASPVMDITGAFTFQYMRFKPIASFMYFLSGYQQYIAK